MSLWEERADEITDKILPGSPGTGVAIPYNACLKQISPQTRSTDPGTLQPFPIIRHWPPDAFPDPELALDEPNGLLAAGGDLGPRRLLHAYRRGIFPWFSEGQPILWWSPDPRAVLWPDALRSSRSLRRTLRRGTFRITGDTAFDRVVRECAAPRAGQDGTWITPRMAAAYGRLHWAGHAHSIECWCGADLAGGLYGVAIGRVFFGESMFSRVSDASKAALVHLCTLGFKLIDCQIPNPHLARLGAVEVERRRFLALLDELCEIPGPYPPADDFPGTTGRSETACPGEIDSLGETTDLGETAGPGKTGA